MRSYCSKSFMLSLFVWLGCVGTSFARLTAPNSFYNSITYSCYGDGTIKTPPNGTCKSGNEWETFAIRACANRSNAQGKTGVNSFAVGVPCIQPKPIYQPNYNGLYDSALYTCADNTTGKVGGGTCKSKKDLRYSAVAICTNKKPLQGTRRGLKNFVLTPCSSGCVIDVDKDGYCAPADCDDNNRNVYPGQLSYFSIPRANGSYDYNCDGLQNINPSLNIGHQKGKHIIDKSKRIFLGNSLFYEYRNGTNPLGSGNTSLCTGKPHPQSAQNLSHVRDAFTHTGTLITSNSQIQCGLVIASSQFTWGKKYTMIGNTCTEIFIPHNITFVSCR